MATKVRAKGWNYTFTIIQAHVNQLIEMTPTSELRNKITEINMALMQLEDYAKEQKEVL